MRLFLQLGLLLCLPLVSLPAQAEFGGNLGGYFGAGKMGQEADTALAKRSIGVFDLQFMPGWRILSRTLLLGLLGDYRFVAQLANSPIDFSGSGYSIGPGSMAELGPVKVLFSYDFIAHEQYSAPDTALSGSGYHLLFGYKFLPATTLDMEYVSATYSTLSESGLPERTLTVPIKFWSFGFGISYAF